MSVKLYIRDNTNGNIHEYGTNQHDALILQDDGSLHYQNLQNGCGTMYPDEGYTFCEADGSDPRMRDDYIQYGVDPYIDIGGNGEEHQAKDTNVPTNRWIRVKDRLPEPWEQVLIYSRHDFCESAFYIGVPGKWCSTWNHEMLDADSVTYWMSMPQPPKGE